MRHWRTPHAVLCATLVAASLVGCTAQGKDPRAAVEAFATALSAGNFEALNYAQDKSVAQQTTRTALGGMGSVRPKVGVGDVYEDGNGKGSAKLNYVWDLGPDGDDDWTYQTTAQLQLDGDVWHPVYAPAVLAPDLLPGERLVTSRSPAERGEILGAGGDVLVTKRAVQRVGIDKSAVTVASQLATSATRLAKLVGIDPAGYTKQVQQAGPKAFVQVIVYRSEDPAVPKPAQLQAIPGARAVSGQAQLAPTSTFARALLGTVGEATAELVKDSGGQIQAGDQTGLSGLQRTYNALLAGKPAITVDAVTGTDADTGRTLFQRPASQGQPLTTTLSLRMQRHAEDLLAQVKPASALVAIRPSTGQILVSANGPGSKGLDTANLGQYAPGSTFKLITALALLRKGNTTQSRIPCTPTITVDGRTFSNYSDYPAAHLGQIPLIEAVAQSCNTAMISAASTVTQEDLRGAAASLGLGAQWTGLGMSAYSGNVPTPQTSGTDHAASMIGQARILASPFAMAVVAASIRAGHTVTPAILTGASATAVPSTSATGPPAKSLTASEAGELQAMMAAVVNGGSGSALQGLPPPVGAKTGTAEYGNAKPPRVRAWLVAYRGDLAVAIFVADGVSGARTAAPIAKAFLTNLN